MRVSVIIVINQSGADKTASRVTLRQHGCLLHKKAPPTLQWCSQDSRFPSQEYSGGDMRTEERFIDVHVRARFGTGVSRYVCQGSPEHGHPPRAAMADDGQGRMGAHGLGPSAACY